MSTLHCVFIPPWPGNPYQELLAKHLMKLGAQIEAVRPRLVFIPAVVRRRRPHVLHLHSLTSFFRSPSTLRSLIRMIISLGQLLLLRLMGVKIVWTAHDLKNHQNKQLVLDRICAALVCRLAHAIIVHCETAKLQVANVFHLNNIHKIFVVPHANYIGTYENKIDRASARKALGIPDSSVVLLSFGLIRPYKGIPELIDAFNELSHNGAYLLIAGNPTTVELGNQIKQKSSGRDNIKFVPGFVPDDEIQVYMNASDAVVFTFRDIFTSGSVLLAMSFGRACIAPKKGCIADVLNDTGGYLYNPNSNRGLLHAMNRTIQNRAKLPRMGAHNRQISKQWSWSRIAGMTLHVYLHILGR